jgi:8-oxo-dGTP pyrophosphatase MutT (NUDIX family)
MAGGPPDRSSHTTAVTAPLQPERAPEWLRPLLDGLDGLDGGVLGRHHVPPGTDGRRSAVLMLFADGDGDGPDVLLTERAQTLRAHAGQVSFPGGRTDPTDADAVATALREAEEETGLVPAGVVPLAVLPDLFVPPSGFVVSPVLAYWADPTAVRAVDPGETAAVVRVGVADLVAPANRLQVRHVSGRTGPAFSVAGLLVWGFTGGLLSTLLHLGGWERPWDATRVLDLDEAWAAARAQRREVAEPVGEPVVQREEKP